MLRDIIERDTEQIITNAWKTNATSDYQDGVRIGSDRADRMVDYLRKTDDVPTFSRVVRSAAKSDQTATEIGFFYRIAALLKRTRIELVAVATICLMQLNKIHVLSEMVTL